MVVAGDYEAFGATTASELRDHLSQPPFLLLFNRCSASYGRYCNAVPRPSLTVLNPPRPPRRLAWEAEKKAGVDPAAAGRRVDTAVSIKALGNGASGEPRCSACFHSGSDAAPLFLAIAARPRNIFLCLLRRLKSGVGIFFWNPKPARRLSPCREHLPKSGENAGEEREGSRVPGELKPPPTCGEAGPRGAGPISTYLLSPGLHPLAAWSCGAQSGTERLAEQYPAVAAASAPLSPTMGLPSGSLASLLFLLLQVSYCFALVPAWTLSGGRAGSACGIGVGERTGLGSLRPTVPWGAL